MRQRRLVAVLFPILALLTIVPAALASGSNSGPSGRYHTTIASPASIKGTWTIRFDNGRDSDYLNGKKVASGTYTQSGSIISFAQRNAPAGQTQCSTPGKYRFMLSGSTLTFTKISDPCNSVRSELLSHPFTNL